MREAFSESSDTLVRSRLAWLARVSSVSIFSLCSLICAVCSDLSFRMASSALVYLRTSRPSPPVVAQR